MDELEAEAAMLAAESLFSREQWRDALAAIGNRPDRLEVARLCGAAAVRQGAGPAAAAVLLVGDGAIPPLLPAPGARRGPTWNELFAPVAEVASRALRELAAWFRENESVLQALAAVGAGRRERLSAMHREYGRRQRARRRRR
jgi:hypothetical protein